MDLYNPLNRWLIDHWGQSEAGGLLVKTREKMGEERRKERKEKKEGVWVWDWAVKCGKRNTVRADYSFTLAFSCHYCPHANISVSDFLRTSIFLLLVADKIEVEALIAIYWIYLFTCLWWPSCWWCVKCLSVSEPMFSLLEKGISIILWFCLLSLCNSHLTAEIVQSQIRDSRLTVDLTLY